MSQSIALVDDDRNILTSVSIALEAEGFNVETYVDGTDALRGISQRPVDLAVLDIKMPRMDGMELLGKIREKSAVPVIFSPPKMMKLMKPSACVWAQTIISKSHFLSVC